MVGTLPEMVQTIVPKDFTQYCSSPPLCTMISYGYTLSLERIFCLPYRLIKSRCLFALKWRLSEYFRGRGELTSEYSVTWVRVRVKVRVGVRVRVPVRVRVRVRVRVGVRVGLGLGLGLGFRLGFRLGLGLGLGHSSENRLPYFRPCTHSAGKTFF